MRYRFLSAVVVWFLVVGATSGPGVAIESGKLTIHARGASLRDVLGAITAQGGVAFRTIGQGQIPEATVTEEFTGLSMEEGIARLLSRWDYALVKEEGTDRLKEVYIFASAASGADSLEVKPGTDTSTGSGSVNEAGGKGQTDDEIRQAIEQVKKAQTPDEQAKAMLNLQHFHDDQTLEQVLRPALLEVSPKVRMAALEAMYLREIRNPDILEEIQLMSVRDPDPAIREKAQFITRRLVPDIVRGSDSNAFWMNP